MGALGAIVLAGIGAALFIALNRGDDETVRPRLGEPSEGGTLRIAVVNLQSLDPAKARDPSAVMVADQLFDTLVTYDPGTLAAEPGIAESWEASVDQRRFTFTLREGLTFHDGTPLAADDVKATLDRIAAPGSDSDFRFLLETVVGYVDYHDEQTAQDLFGVKVVDDRHLAIELNQPFAQFPLVLGNPGFGIVPSEKVGDPDFGDAPVGSGPLEFVEQGDDVVSLARREGYQPKATWVDRVELHLMDDPDTAFDALQDRQVDLAPVPADRVNEAAATYGEPGFGPFLGVLFYGMNLHAPVFQDARMRQAVIHAVDRGRIVEVVYDGTIILADGFVPSGVPEAVENACGDRCRHDRDQAAALVREVFPDGNVPELHIDFDEDPVQRAVASAIQSDLEGAGIPATLRPHEFKDYGVFLVSEQPELFRLGWTADYPSADGFLFPLFVSGQRDNLMRFTAREVDQLLQSARAERDPAQRTELYRAAEQQVLDRVPVLPIAQFTNRWAAAPHVGGFTMTPLGTFPVTDVFVARSTASSG